jgi:predicted DNA-binding transcriptional regulator AlpA
MNVSEILNERQVQEFYGFSIPYLRRARHERRGPRFLKVGKLVRYRRSDIEAYLTAHAVETTDAPVHADDRRSATIAGR